MREPEARANCRLFELEKDPLEEMDLAGEPAHAAERVRLDQMLRTIVDQFALVR